MLLANFTANIIRVAYLLNKIITCKIIKVYCAFQGEVTVWAPSALFSLIALVAAVSVFLLPETTNKIMPQGIDEEDEDERGNEVNECGPS